MEKSQLQDQLNRYLNFLKQDKNNLNLLLSISGCYRDLGEIKDAQEYLDAAKKIDLESCLIPQGLLDLKAGNFIRAKELFTQMLSQQDTPLLRYYLALSLYLNREFPQATEVLTPLAEEAFFHEARLLMAKLLHNQQRTEEAIVLLEPLADTATEDAEITGLLALLYYDNGDQEHAEMMVKRTLKINPDNYSGQLVQILLQLASGETPIEAIDKLLLVNPNDCRLLFALGTTHLRNLQFSDAQQAFTKANELWPKFYDSWISLGWCQLFQDNIAGAEHSYQQAVTIAEEIAAGWGGLALVNALRMDLVEAEQLIKHARKLDPDCFLSNVAEIICANYLQSEEAKKQFDRIFPQAADQINAAITALLAEQGNARKIH
ncbi:MULTISPECIES: tetratricopeptide repeat protein [unclassified Legionella]|uniref:tetratricopeptide repeat protein n=1 Tax=unclassified Legionella TaxID=2622702 RepID=UPI001054384C|nr:MULTISPECIES: tetratricopeptide repeat protein [unclassified Legionella]MDI9817543.1 CDC27 family protein [Legionella sp. PL877]